MKFDLDSPLFSKACKNLGLNPSDITMQEYESFKQKGVSDDVVELRWKHYRSRLFMTINEVLEERQRLRKCSVSLTGSIVKNQKDDLNLTADMHSTSILKYNSAVPGGDKWNNMTVRGSKVLGSGALSVTRNQLSLNDISMVTDMRVQEEQRRLEREKQKFIVPIHHHHPIQRDTQRMFSEDVKRKSIEDKLVKQEVKVEKSFKQASKQVQEKKALNYVKFQKVKSA